MSQTTYATNEPKQTFTILLQFYGSKRDPSFGKFNDHLMMMRHKSLSGLCATSQCVIELNRSESLLHLEFVGTFEEVKNLLRSFYAAGIQSEDKFNAYYAPFCGYMANAENETWQVIFLKNGLALGKTEVVDLIDIADKDEILHKRNSSSE